MSAAAEVCAALGENADASVALLEPRGGDAGFLVASLVWRALADSEGSVCLLCVRDAAPRHRAVARKLGHDLAAAERDGRAVLLEPLADRDAAVDREAVDGMFEAAARALASLPGRKCLVVDDLGDLLCAGAPLTAAVLFLDRLVALRRADSGLRTVIGCGFDDGDDERRALAGCVARASRRRYTVAGLATGPSSQVTGSVLAEDFDPHAPLVARSRMFHYRAADRAVKLFAPGAAGLGS